MRRQPAVVSAPPEIDPVTRDLFETELLACGQATIVVDMSQTDYCDCSGISVLLHARNRAEASGGDLMLAGIGPVVARILQVLGLHELFVICDSVDEALQRQTGP